ncbi:DNA ligase, partial [Candidatus Gottesmanbacteria bacterium]|nr:DNA ligase [Candidatus Gottesmanbacteria bacterium]
MTFKRLSEYFAQLEATTLRNKMTEILAALFKEAKADEIGKLCYLLQGRVAPQFSPVEFGIADRMMVRAIALGLDVSQDKVTKAFKQEGDLGKAVEKLKAQSSKLKAKEKKLTILDVYEILYNVATAGGSGSQEIKIKLLGDLLHDVDPLSSRYIVKITLAKLRMGFSDMTMLDSLSWMLAGTKELRVEIERAYNVRPDLGFISETIKRKGIEGLRHVEPKVGTPILMARAERMTNGKDIIEKIGKCAIEPKFDGLRLQVHFRKDKGKDTSAREHPRGVPQAQHHPWGGGIAEVEESVRLFSRNLEDVTFMYPDIVAGVRKEIKAKEAIFEGEAIGINLKTGAYLTFQETVQRKRKDKIDATAKKVPLKLIAF